VKERRFHKTLITITWLLLANRESRSVASPVTLFGNVDTFSQTSFAFLSAILQHHNVNNIEATNLFPRSHFNAIAGGKRVVASN
jgi:hypothetical protein